MNQGYNQVMGQMNPVMPQPVLPVGLGIRSVITCGGLNCQNRYCLDCKRQDKKIYKEYRARFFMKLGCWAATIALVAVSFLFVFYYSKFQGCLISKEEASLESRKEICFLIERLPILKEPKCCEVFLGYYCEHKSNRIEQDTYKIAKCDLQQFKALCIK